MSAPKSGLRLGDVTLPEETVTQTFAILGMRGSGKTTTARVLTEGLLARRLPTVVLDPTGVWWGLRTSADGRHPGHPVAIFGGDHGDLPLEETAGHLIANAICDQHIPAVLDLSRLSKSAARRFTTDFLERLYHRNRDPMHVVIDEADLFAPQRVPKGAERLLGAMEDLVRRGRVRGLGVTLITQRPAVLHKDVLSQAEVLVALRMTGVRDVNAINEWVELHATPEEASTLKRSLPSLPVGTAWVWSPGWLQLLKQIQVQVPHTFDSSATPKPGVRRTAVRQMAEVDLKALGEQIAEAAERAQAEDPKALRQQIAELTRQLSAARAATPAPERVEVPVPVITPEDLAALRSLGGEVGEHMATALERAQAFEERIRKLLAAAEQLTPSTPQPARTVAPSAPRTAPGPRPAPRAKQAPPRRPTPGDAVSMPQNSVPLRAGALRMLQAVASLHPMPLTKAQVGTLAKVKSSGGTFSTYLGELKRAGYLVEEDGELTITGAGFDALGTAPPAPATAEEVRALWRDRLRAGARRMLDTLIGRYPDGLTKEELAAAADVTASGGTFSTYLGDLRRAGLAVEVSGLVFANEVLFIGAQRAGR